MRFRMAHLFYAIPKFGGQFEIKFVGGFEHLLLEFLNALIEIHFGFSTLAHGFRGGAMRGEFLLDASPNRLLDRGRGAGIVLADRAA